MPYRSKRDRAEYMRRYRKAKRRQLERAMKALEKGDLARARRILGKKHEIHLKPRGRLPTTTPEERMEYDRKYKRLI